MIGFILKIVVAGVLLVGFFVLEGFRKRARASGAEGTSSAIQIGRWTAFGLAILMVALIIGSFVRVVPANTSGVPSTFGNVGAPLASGIHLTAPWTEVTQFSTRTQELSMLRATDEGDLAKDDSIDVIARLGGAMKVDLTIRFSVDPLKVGLLFRQAGSLEVTKDRFVRPEAREVARNVFGQYTAEEGYSTARAEIGAEITEQLKIRLEPHGIIIESVNVRDVLPEQQVLDAINSILQSRNEAARAIEDQRKLVTEADTRRQVAEKEAEALQISAQAEASAVLIAAQAEAEANAQIALSLTPELLELQLAKACAEAIASSAAQVVTVCSPGQNGSATGGTGGATSVIIDGRAPTTTTATTTPPGG